MKQLCLTSLLVLVLLVAAACASPSPTPPVAPIQPATTPTATATQSPPLIQRIPTNTPAPEPTPLPSATPTAQPTPCGQPAGWPAYTIQAGDTLFSIAYNTGTSVDQLKLANCLVGDTIYAGQALFVPFIPYIPPAFSTLPPMPQINSPQGAVVQPELGPAPPPPPPPPGEPRLNVDPGRGRAGITFTLVITGFQPLEAVTVAIESSTGATVGNFTVPMNGDGASNYLWQSPSDLAPGFYKVKLVRSDGTPGPSGTIVIVP